MEGVMWRPATGRYSLILKAVIRLTSVRIIVAEKCCNYPGPNVPVVISSLIFVMFCEVQIFYTFCYYMP